MPLEEYRRKRDFSRTPEPAGSAARRAGEAPLFVIQKHDARQLHYDLRLELDAVLKSWAVPKGPSLDPSVRRLAMHVEDHPLEYGDFEGVIPQGEYGGGTVMLWDIGTWRAIEDPRAGYKKGRLKFELDGQKLRGAWTLVRMRGQDDSGDPWLLIKEKDGAAVPEADGVVTDQFPDSVVTGRDLDAIAEDRDRVWHSDRNPDGSRAGGGEAEADPDPSGSGARALARAISGRSAPNVSDLTGAAPQEAPDKRPSPQLATLSKRAPTGDDWLHEIKLDGYRVLIRKDADDVRVLTRSGKDWTDRFAGLAVAAGDLACERALIDGEAVVLDEAGISSFGALQQALARGTDAGIVCFTFDILHLNGYDLTNVPLRERKATLRALLPEDDTIRFSDHVVGSGGELFKQACAMGLEGIVSKRADAPYREGRSRAWLKTKCERRQEFVVVGFTEPSGSRKGLGALILAVNDDAGNLIYSGRVGTGFTERTLKQLHDRLAPLETETSPVTDPPGGALGRGVHWVEPRLVAEVRFIEWTAEGVIRHASFQGLREDKSPDEIVRESETGIVSANPDPDKTENDGPNDDTENPGGGSRGKRPARDPVIEGVRITNPDKVLYPDSGVTKRDLVDYWQAVADVALPFLDDRPLTLYRCPNGIKEGGFFQKHAGDGTPDVVPRVEVEGEDYLKVTGVGSLIALVQLGVLEFHVWGARADKLDRPDRIVFDLDPDEDLAWRDVVSAALLVREFLATLELQSFAKTTGGKGLHVMVPIDRISTWDEVKDFARVVAEGFASASPDRFTANMAKRHRQGRIYLDYLRNMWNSTAVAGYSTRARLGAPVSVPVSWDELSEMHERPEFSVRNVPQRVAQGVDPWPGFEKVRQSLSKEVLRQVGLA